LDPVKLLGSDPVRVTAISVPAGGARARNAPSEPQRSILIKLRSSVAERSICWALCYLLRGREAIHVVLMDWVAVICKNNSERESIERSSIRKRNLNKLIKP
jgi:hypothetical protein